MSGTQVKRKRRKAMARWARRRIVWPRVDICRYATPHKELIEWAKRKVDEAILGPKTAAFLWSPRGI